MDIYTKYWYIDINEAFLWKKLFLLWAWCGKRTIEIETNAAKILLGSFKIEI